MGFLVSDKLVQSGTFFYLQLQQHVKTMVIMC